MVDWLPTTSFNHEHRGCEILYGRGRIADLEEFLAERGLQRALIVCGSNVGSNDELLGPIQDGLGDRCAGVFDGTTPDKRVGTVYELLAQVDATGADVLVGVGGGSSLDIARQATVLAADGRSLETLRENAAAEGKVDQPADVDPAMPVVVVPTTFAGADLSTSGSLLVLPADESPSGQPVLISGSAMPIADVIDPALFETTPTGALAGSAMNGFDKGIETPYARDSSAVSDAVAIHGLRYLSDTLPVVASEGNHSAAVADVDGIDSVSDAMDRAALGSLLVQLDRKPSVIHAFGHGFARRYDVQQGNVHAVLAPHVLSYIFEYADGSRYALANGLGLDADGLDADATGEAVVQAVTEMRNSLAVPQRIRDLPETRKGDIPAIAAFVVDDWMMPRAPADLEVSEAVIEAVLRDAW